MISAARGGHQNAFFRKARTVYILDLVPKTQQIPGEQLIKWLPLCVAWGFLPSLSRLCLQSSLIFPLPLPPTLYLLVKKLNVISLHGGTLLCFLKTLAIEEL